MNAIAGCIPRLRRASAEMEDVDRLDWTSGLAITAYGRRIGVRVNDAGLLGIVAKYLPCGWKHSAGHEVERLYSLFASGRQHNPRLRRPHVLFGSGEPLARSLHLADILDALEQDARFFVAGHARGRIFVHAAVVGWNGRAIVMPGRTMSGKTTLAAAFVRAGAIYYSDEYAVLDDRGFVHPYAKPLSMRSAEDGYTQTDYPVEAIGGRAGTKPLRIGTILITEYSKAAQWRPRPLSRGMGAMSLLANTFGVRARPERTINVLWKAVTNASVYKSSRGEPGKVVHSVVTSTLLPSPYGESEVNL